jgi:hypothetical protein
VVRLAVGADVQTLSDLTGILKESLCRAFYRMEMVISFRTAEKVDSVIGTYQGRRYPHTAKGERRELIGVDITFDR